MKRLICRTKAIHKDAVHSVQKNMLPESKTNALAAFFTVFADSTRVRILTALSEQELCVCDIASLLRMGQSAVSHQLTVLRSARLVSFRRDGKTVFYRLNDDHIDTILRDGIAHINERGVR